MASGQLDNDWQFRDKIVLKQTSKILAGLLSSLLTIEVAESHFNLSAIVQSICPLLLLVSVWSVNLARGTFHIQCFQRTHEDFVLTRASPLLFTTYFAKVGSLQSEMTLCAFTIVVFAFLAIMIYAVLIVSAVVLTKSKSLLTTLRVKAFPDVV